MTELAKHIEVLLLENDCVIVPGLGGFIAHNRPAEFKESANIFCPPTRTIGFNPQLVMNDGLLVQSYMQAYNTDFPDATRKIEKVVSEIKEQLYQNGQAEIENVGTIYFTMNGVYGFEPCAGAFFNPHMYGLGNFTLSRLEEKAEVNTVAVAETKPSYSAPALSNEVNNSKSSNKIIRLITENLVGAAAAVILFFVLSIPVENTYMDNANYASLGAETMWDAIKNRSAATLSLGSENKRGIEQAESGNDMEESQQQQNKNVVRTKNNVNTLVPVAVKSVKFEENANTKETKEVKAEKEEKIEKKEKVEKEEKADKAVKETKPANTTKLSHIIVSSLPTMADAEKELKKFKAEGYSSASVIESNGRFRISLYSFENASDAYQKVKELKKKDNKFKDIWVFKSK